MLAQSAQKSCAGEFRSRSIGSAGPGAAAELDLLLAHSRPRPKPARHHLDVHARMKGQSARPAQKALSVTTMGLFVETIPWSTSILHMRRK